MYETGGNTNYVSVLEVPSSVPDTLYINAKYSLNKHDIFG